MALKRLRNPGTISRNVLTWPAANWRAAFSDSAVGQWIDAVTQQGPTCTGLFAGLLDADVVQRTETHIAVAVLHLAVDHGLHRVPEQPRLRTAAFAHLQVQAAAVGRAGTSLSPAQYPAASTVQSPCVAAPLPTPKPQNQPQQRRKMAQRGKIVKSGSADVSEAFA